MLITLNNAFIFEFLHVYVALGNVFRVTVPMYTRSPPETICNTVLVLHMNASFMLLWLWHVLRTIVDAVFLYSYTGLAGINLKL